MAFSLRCNATLSQTGLRSKATASRRTLICKAFQEGETAPSTPSTSAPSWLPKEAEPALSFFASESTELSSVVAPLKQNALYEKYIKDFVESQVAKESVGWKKIPEAVNSRCAMIGFLTAALSEIFGGGSVLSQFAGHPQFVLATIALITAGTIIPVVKGTNGEYLASLKETYTIPEGWFTDVNEKVNGRVAMLGLTTLILIEMIIGKALL